MISAWTRLSVLACAAACWCGGVIDCRAQQTEAARQMIERVKAEADQGDALKQIELGRIHETGMFGAARNGGEAVKWYRKAAEQGNAEAQHALALCHANGIGTAKDFIQAARWFRRAAEQGHRKAQFDLAYYYRKGIGVPRDYVEAYKWYQLAAIQGQERARNEYYTLSKKMTRPQIVKAENLVMEFNKYAASKNGGSASSPPGDAARPLASGMGFFISEDGYLVTSGQLVRAAGVVRLQTAQGAVAARVVKSDAVSGLAILKAEGRFSALPIASSRGVRLGATPLAVSLAAGAVESVAPQTTSVEVARLVGAQDDPRHFELSVPAGTELAGAAVVDAQGNLIAVFNPGSSAPGAAPVGKSMARKMGYAVKSSFLLSFLESLPEVTAGLKAANTTERSPEVVEREVRRALVAVQVR